MMSMISPEKKMASLIVATPKVEKVSDNETDYSIGMEAAGKDIAEAIEKKDVKLLVAGLKDLFTMLLDEHEMGESEIEDEGEDSMGMEGNKKGWK